MKDFQSIFNWVNLNQGRARFSGGIRGADEQGHETFAVEVNSSIYYGEIKKTFLPDKSNYNLEIVSFGYFDVKDVGGPMRQPIINHFSEVDARRVQNLITALVSSASTWESKPSVMSQSDYSRFMQEIHFRDEWIVVDQQFEGVAS
jgi:hypothetical protein